MKPADRQADSFTTPRAPPVTSQRHGAHRLWPRASKRSGSPYFHTTGGRASIRFEPTDSIEANFTYQHLYTHQNSYAQLFGTGAPGGTYTPASSSGYTVPAVVPANYNGPAITPFERLSSKTDPDVLYNRSDIGTAQIDWHFLGQTLTYDGSYWRWALRHGGYTSVAADQAAGVNAADPLPPLATDLPYTTQGNVSQEMRISSETPLFGFMDYTAGVFYRKTTNQVDAVQGATFLGGAFGSPLEAANPFIFDPAYTLQADVHSPSSEQEVSEFAHLTFHLPDDTELTAGGRYLDYRKSGYTQVNLLTSNTSIAVPLSIDCASFGFTSTYAGACDIPGKLAITNTVALPYTPQNLKDHPFIYNVSLSHKLDPDLLVYVSSGGSWRPPAQSVGIYNAANDPTLASLLHLQTEKSYEVEGGFKWTFLEKRGRLNVTYYHQKFDGFIYEGLPAVYLQDNGVSTTPTSFSSNSNPDAVVNGVDFDTGFQITRDWNFNLSASYANGHLTAHRFRAVRPREASQRRHSRLAPMCSSAPRMPRPARRQTSPPRPRPSTTCLSRARISTVSFVGCMSSTGAILTPVSFT